MLVLAGASALASPVRTIIAGRAQLFQLLLPRFIELVQIQLHDILYQGIYLCFVLYDFSYIDDLFLLQILQEGLQI